MTSDLQYALDTAHIPVGDEVTYLVLYDWTTLSKADNPQATLAKKVKACGYTLLQYGLGQCGRYLVVRRDNHEEDE